jgi:uncharacterized protein (DUF1810 family)
METEPLTLQRFVSAQRSIYPQVLEELSDGAKRSHWMWYIFPQVRGLGVNEMSRFYSLENLQEARDYLAHPLLGARLRECCEIVLGLKNKTANQIFGSPDDLKFRSCLTLFALAAPKEAVFKKLLDKYYKGFLDPKSIELLKAIEAG